ncbi:MAG: hypothetical protein ACYTDX_07355, partial [Planctomycetota bacterium]
MNEQGTVPRRRPPWGILDAAGLLVLVLGATWVVAPLPRSVRDAALETNLREDVVAIAHVLRQREQAGGDFAGLGVLLRENPDLAAGLPGWKRTGTPDLLEGHGCWLQVLLSDGEGRAVPTAESDPESRDRGFLVLAWPKDPDATHARGQAALTGGAAWQFDGRAPASSDGPPRVRITFPRDRTVEP